MLLSDASAGVVGAAHAGRQGVVGGVVPAMLDAMPRCGARRGDISARVGPPSAGRCYEVPAELQDEVAAVVPRTAYDDGPAHPAWTCAPVSRAPLATGRRVAEVCGRCTYEDRSLFSYRRDGVTGRQAGVVWLAPDVTA